MDKITPKEIRARLSEEASELQDNLRTPLNFSRSWLTYITFGMKTKSYGREKQNSNDF